ncbi:MAG: CCA tRNA nucleotidyltransferase [Nanoarchaeota archaeon]
MEPILKIIKPSKEEEKQFSTTVASFLERLNKNLDNATAILGGSGAKGTWLSGNHDIDIFVQYDYKKFKDKSSELSGYLLKSLNKAFPKLAIAKVHGSRDYFQLRYEHLSFEVVPILKISKAEDAVNITDVSPLHSQWVIKNASKIKDDIRLLKQFCKANNLYGAESYITGFSGYVLEILAVYYGSFEKVLKASQKWKEKEVIDASDFYKKKDALFHINSSKLHSPLIVVDPVDKDRNAAAALSSEKWLLFKELARKYIQKPSDSFFEKEKTTLDFLRQKHKGKNVVFIAILPLEGKEDVVGVKLLKVFQFLQEKLDGFKADKSGWQWDKGDEAAFYYVLKLKELPAYEIKNGPPLKLKEYVADFKKKYKDYFEEAGRIKAKVKTEHPKLDDFVKSLLKEDYVSERIGKVKKVEVL